MAAALPLLSRHGIAQTAMSRATAFAFSFTTLDGNELRLSEQTGRPVLVVNTASLCGYTPQYSGLETLWTRYRDRGLLVLGVPSNDFGGQEPGGASEIHDTAHRHGVTFPLTEKVAIQGRGAHPFYRWAATQRPGETPALELSQISGRARRHPRGRLRLSDRADRPTPDRQRLSGSCHPPDPAGQRPRFCRGVPKSSISGHNG